MVSICLFTVFAGIRTGVRWVMLYVLSIMKKMQP